MNIANSTLDLLDFTQIPTYLILEKSNQIGKLQETKRVWPL